MPLIQYLKQRARNFLRDRGYELYRRPWLPKGFDPLETLRSDWPQWSPRIVFDVGANVGQTVERISAVFPAATIHAFEPVPATHAALQAAAASRPLVHAHCLALAESAGEMTIAPQVDSTLNSLKFSSDHTSADGISIRRQTATAFCAAHQIARIDLLKIDVEGAELSVLRGAEPLLAAGAVDFVLVEAGLTAGDSRFTPLAALTEFLQPHGFWPVGIYDQHGWTHFHAAEFCNVLYAHERHLKSAPQPDNRP
jgi:FkbM family methyltransferase